MQISPVQSTAAAANSSAAATTPSQDLNDMFLKLLVTQLKSQSPLDPNAFVSQLATFNSLSELTQIRQILQKIATV